MSTRVLVTQQGARGDGRTDDAPAILRAATAACEGACTLVFPPGVYRVARSVTLPTGRPHRIEGEGAILSPSDGYGGPGLVLDESSGGLTLRGLAIVGFEVGLRLSGLRDARMSGLQIRSCGVGVQLAGGDGVELSHSVFTDNTIDLWLGTGPRGLSRVHLFGNRLDGATPVRFVQDDASAALTELILGPGELLAGTLSIPSWASRTTVLHSTLGGLSDAGRSTTVLGVTGVSDRLRGSLLLRGQLGLAVPVPAEEKLVTVTFRTEEEDNSYFLGISPSWRTTWSINAKRTDGFDVRFGTMAPTNARFDWNLVR